MQHQNELAVLLLLAVLLSIWRTRHPHGPRPPGYIFFIEPSATVNSPSPPIRNRRGLGNSTIDLGQADLSAAINTAVQAGYVLIIIKANNKATAALYFEAWVKILSGYHGVVMVAMVGNSFLGGRRYFRYFK